MYDTLSTQYANQKDTVSNNEFSYNTANKQDNLSQFRETGLSSKDLDRDLEMEIEKLKEKINDTEEK